MACPACDSIETPTLLGELGARCWVRCRECGCNYSMSAAALEDQADDMPYPMSGRDELSPDVELVAGAIEGNCCFL